MRVQTKLNILLFFLSLVFMGGIFFHRAYENNRLNTILKEDYQEKDAFINKLLALKGESLRALAFDYTYWDEMVAFTQKKDLSWARENIDENVLSTYHTDAIWVFDPALSLIYSIHREGLDGLKEPPFSSKLIRGLFAEELFCHFFLNSKEGLLEFRGASIHPGSDPERKTPANGYFFTARLWNKAYLEELSRLSGGEAEVSGTKRDLPSFNETVKNSTMLFLHRFDDFNKKPAAYLYVKVFSNQISNFNKLSQRSVIIFIIYLIMILVVIALFFTFSVSLPLAAISQSLRGEDTGNLDLLGRDSGEFGDISRLISRFFEQRRDIIREITERKLAEGKASYINRLYSVLSNVNQSIVRIREQEELFKAICRIIVEDGLFRLAWIGLIDRDASLIKPAAFWGAEDGYLSEVTIPLESQGPVSTAIREGKHYVCNDIENDPRMQPRREQALKRDYQSLAVFLITIGPRIVGILAVYTSQKDFFDDKEVSLLHELSIDISFALGNMEEEKRRKQAEMELMLAYERLKSTQSQLVQSAKMASVGLLAGGVAHEINNPLTGVLNNVQLIKMMLEQKKDFNPDEFKSMLNIIEESAKRCTTITRSLLDFSHSSKGVLQNLSLNEAVEKAIVLVEEELKLDNVLIHREFDPKQPQVFGDAQLLEQVVFDLISNAKWAIQKKTGREGGSITIKTGPGPDSGTVLLSVADNGTGINKEDLERVFEPFFTTKPVGEGTGLGLSIVYGIVKDHHGNISVESEIGKGTIFKIVLPLA